MAITVTGSTLSVTLSNATDLELGGHLTWTADNTKDIGASGANRPRTGYYGTSVVTPSVTNAGTLALSATGANVITLSTNGSERARVSSGGNLLVGTTTDDGASKLQVAGSVRLSGAGYALKLGGRTGGSDMSIYAEGDVLYWYSAAASASLMTLSAAGPLTVHNNQATTGVTSLVVRAGAGQSTNAIVNITANDGTTSVFKVLETKIGFFNATPVVKQTVTADAASILAALQAYGLAV